MKLEFGLYSDGSSSSSSKRLTAHVVGETDCLTDVILCAPHHLAPIPCCSVTRTHLSNGFSTCTDEALAQHAALTSLLKERGVRCHMIDAAADLPDMCFTRDIGVSTPFGLVALNPAMPHRRGEVAALINACKSWNLPTTRIEQGTIEGGDICIAREGLLLIGMSGERSSAEGVDAFAAPFRAAGWEVLICPFHADHLHLDTIFCMLDRGEALGCVDLLDADFLQAVEARGIRVLRAPARSAATLGCNILSLGDRRIIASAHDEPVGSILTDAGYFVDQVNISQFAACGGGIHCLTQPLRRVAG